MSETRIATISEWNEILEKLQADIKFAESEYDNEKIQKAYKRYFRYKDLCPHPIG